MKRKHIFRILAALCVCLAGGASLWSRTAGPEPVFETAAESVAGSSPETDSVSAELTVHICGAVGQAGVYTLPAGSRVGDAVEAAGGFLPEADSAYLNLAEPVTDGSQIRVPTIQEAAEQADSRSGLVNINRAGKEALMTLPGIGEAKAEAILRYREEAGDFRQIEDIMQVPGIKEAAFSKIRDKIVTEN